MIERDCTADESGKIFDPDGNPLVLENGQEWLDEK